MRYHILAFLLMISSVFCFRMNDDRFNQDTLKAYKQDLLSRVKSKHPLVRELGDGDDPYTFSDPGMNNKTNSMDYEFQDYRLYNNIRWLWNAYLIGANATWYAPNSTVCFNNALNIAQYDVDLLVIKYMYGDVRDNMLNTTYFISNISDVSYSCLDAGENFYVYAMYKFRLFGEDWTNVMLGALQNLLKMTLSINKINNKLQEADDAGRYDEVYYHFGRITALVLDYDPVILEDAANPLSDPNFVYGATAEEDEDIEIYYQSISNEPESSFDIKKARANLKHPLVKDTIIPTVATPVTNAALWTSIAGSATAQAFTNEQLGTWVVATYSADQNVLAAAKVYYTAVATANGGSAIITRADFNAWWASAERNEKLRTAFFQIQMDAWKIPYGGGSYGSVNLQQRETQLRNKYTSTTQYSDGWIILRAQEWMLFYDSNGSGTVTFAEWVAGLMGPTTTGRDTGFNPDDDAINESTEISVVTGRAPGGADGNLLSELELFDWTFGLKDELPGLKYLMTVQGPIEFYRGFINGTRLTKDNDTYACDDILTYQVAPTIEKTINVTETLFSMTNFYEIVYVLFDDGLLLTRMMQLLHPTAYHCYYAGENTYWHFNDVIVVQNGYSPKPYLMNIVYNFGHIWDTLRDFYLFWAEDPRGQVNSVHDAGYNLGFGLYLLITPGIASYQTQAVAYTPAKYQ